MKILNLYSWIWWNRRDWVWHDVVAVEKDPILAKIYQDRFPDDKVIVWDAHDYLLKNFKEFDFIWSSPPCQMHTCAFSHANFVYHLLSPACNKVPTIVHSSGAHVRNTVLPWFGFDTEMRNISNALPPRYIFYLSPTDRPST